ncbi:MAG TPA: STAS domain-containing protein [Candidatus Angelobacter sp.]
MFEIRIEHRGKTPVLHCSGRIAGEALTRLRESVICELGAQTIVLDLALVTAIDAAGLGLLVFLHTRAAGRGCALKLCAPSPQVTRVLALTGLDSVLTICCASEIDRSQRASAASVRQHQHDDADCALCG